METRSVGIAVEGAKTAANCSVCAGTQAETRWSRGGGIRLGTHDANLTDGRRKQRALRSRFGLGREAAWAPPNACLDEQDVCFRPLGTYLEGTRNNFFHNLVASTVDALDARVRVHAGHEIFVHVAVAAKELNARVDNAALRFGRPELRH